MTRMFFATAPSARQARKGDHTAEIRSQDALREDRIEVAPRAPVARSRLTRFRRAIQG